MKKPNVIVVFADQWRGQALGYAGDVNVRTPNIDAFASESINCVNAYSGCPVCSPYRASLLTGRNPLEHGVFVNDVRLSSDATSLAEAFSDGGYETAYIGKWHLDGHGRSNYIPPEYRQGFAYWKVLECTHSYNESPYYDNNCEEKVYWDGYDAYAQTEDAVRYINKHDKEKPYFMVLSWGPPHNPYQSAPERFRKMYDPQKIILPENVPAECAAQTREDLAGYYAHCSALDECFARLLRGVEESGGADETVLLFTSDHGDMLGAHGLYRKQRPYAEAVRVPFLLRYPQKYEKEPGERYGFIDAPDIMPTLLEIAGVEIPQTVSGRSFAQHFSGGADPSEGMGLIACYHPFGEFERRLGGVEYRGIITGRYTYVKTLAGPWLMFDNLTDPGQQHNLVEDLAMQKVRYGLEVRLDTMLQRAGDTFEHGDEYIRRWGYKTGANGTVAYIC